MSECIREKYLQNGKVKNSMDFSNNLINEGLSFYEVIRIIKGKYLFLEDHICRLKSSMHLYDNGYKADFKKIIYYLLKYKIIIGLKEGNVKVVNNYSNGLNQLPQTFIYQVKHYYPTSDEYEKGVVASLLYGKRTNPNVKFINLKINKLVAKEFSNKNIYETLLIDELEYITEGSKSNVFFIKGNEVFTTPDKQVLLGITRKHVIELCKKLKITIRKTNIHIDSIGKFDAAFITGTSVKILPLKQIDRYKFKIKNNTMRKLMNYFNIQINDYLAGTDENNSFAKV